MLTYSDFVNKYGPIKQGDFESLLQIVEEQFQSVVESKVPYWCIGGVDLTAKDLDRAFAIQIKMLSGIDYLNTQYDSVAGISSVTTEGFTIDYSNRTKDGRQFPLSKIASSILTVYLRNNGFMKLGVM